MLPHARRRSPDDVLAVTDVPGRLALTVKGAITRLQLRQRIVAASNHLPAAATRALRMTSVGSRLLRPIMNRLLPSAATVVSVRSGAAAGATLLILPREEKYYWTGQYEREVQRATVDLLRPGDQFWDIGAHIGFFTVIASRAVGPAGKVHAFEPYGPSRDRLRSNITLNHLRNVVVHEEALSAASGSSILHANAVSSIVDASALVR
jgi:Met-10+ like-protein